MTRVLRQGRAVFTNLLGIKALSNKIGVFRAAVVVSTKVHKRAVQRNLIKRRIRSVLEGYAQSITTPVDLVILAQTEAVGRKQADLGAAIEYCLKKLGLL